MEHNLENFTNQCTVVIKKPYLFQFGDIDVDVQITIGRGVLFARHALADDLGQHVSGIHWPGRRMGGEG